MLNTTSLNEQIKTEPETIPDDEQKERLYRFWRAYIQNALDRRGIRNAFYSYGRIYNAANRQNT